MVSDEALKKLQEQIAAWPMAQRFVVQRLIRDYLRNREDLRAYKATGLTPEDITAAVSIPMLVKAGRYARAPARAGRGRQRRTHGDGAVLQELRVRGGLRPDGRQKGNILPLPALDPPLRKRQHFHARAGKPRFLQLRQAKGGINNGTDILRSVRAGHHGDERA